MFYGYFREVDFNILNKNSIQAKEDRIEIKDTDPVTFGRLLELLYTGKITGAFTLPSFDSDVGLIFSTGHE